MKIALLQTPVGMDKEENLRHAREQVRIAAQNGAELVILPEMFCCPYSTAYFAHYAEPKGGHIWRELSRWATENRVCLVGGTFPEWEGEKLYNTCFVFGPDGRQLARHRKMHLFDIAVEGGQYFKESDTLSAGNTITTFETEFGTMGLAICFDMRFEELCRCQEHCCMQIMTAGVSSLSGRACKRQTAFLRHGQSIHICSDKQILFARISDNSTYSCFCNVILCYFL